MTRSRPSATRASQPFQASQASAASTVEFAAAARTLAREARRHGFVGPSFRCPPRLVGVDRTVRWRRGGAIISVRLRGRPWNAVLADMIEGVVVANRLTPPRSDRLRTELWRAAGGVGGGARRAGDPPATRVA